VKYGDVIGYIVAGEYYCVACAPTNEEAEEVKAILGGQEYTDAWSHCCLCEELIPEQLTADGEIYHLDKLRAYLVDRKGRPEILHQWATVLREYYAYGVERELCDLAMGATEDLKSSRLTVHGLPVLAWAQTEEQSTGPRGFILVHDKAKGEWTTAWYRWGDKEWSSGSYHKNQAAAWADFIVRVREVAPWK
jgi:hypothetical protein